MSLLSDLFFPYATAAELSDPTTYRYLPAVAETESLITGEEIEGAIKRCKPNSASGPDGIPNRLLKLLIKSILPTVVLLFRACAEQGYHLLCFREAHTIAIKKPNKPNYTLAKAYRLIALLNTLGKVLESIITKHIAAISETQNLLSDSQIGGRRQRSCETALELLTEQIHTVWNTGSDKLATILSIDVAGTFGHVSAERMLHNLRKRKIPE